MRPKISIIMPSLNVAPYVEKSVLSAVSQTMDNIEILLVDAGSTDGTMEILEKYTNFDIDGKSVKLIHSKHKSYGYQVNLGIERANGEYISIIETDDYIDKDMMRELYRIAQGNNADMVRADYISFYSLENGVVIETSHSLFEEETDYGLVNNTGNDNYLFLHDQSIWKGIYRKDFLTDNGIRFNESDGAAYQDLGFILQCLACDSKIVYLNKHYYHYRVNRPGASSNSLNCLKYAYQEFSRFTNEKDKYKRLLESEGFYLRMMQTFASEYKKVIRQCKYDYNSQYLVSYYDYFAKELERRFDFSISVSEFEKGSCFEDCKRILESPKRFSIELNEEDKRKNELMEELLSLIGDSCVYVFGAGKRGRAAVRALCENDICVEGFIDNDSGKRGKLIDGIKVFHLDEVVAQIGEEEALIGIANKLNKCEIYSQILGLGLDKEQIVFLDDYLFD